jgi:hypothetical protein
MLVYVIFDMEPSRRFHSSQILNHFQVVWHQLKLGVNNNIYSTDSTHNIVNGGLLIIMLYQ